ncbi:MAG: hypothetical protein ACE5FD_19320 [Anaerolineae bacterium]
MITIIVHINNEDAVVCEVDEIPDSTNQFLTLQNPRRRDGKDVHYLDEDVTTMLVPWHRVNFVQVLPSGVEEDVMGFVRE